MVGSERLCAGCATEVPEGTSLCPECGRMNRFAPAAPPSVPAAPAAPPPTAGPGPRPMPTAFGSAPVQREAPQRSRKTNAMGFASTIGVLLVALALVAGLVVYVQHRRSEDRKAEAAAIAPRRITDRATGVSFVLHGKPEVTSDRFDYQLLGPDDRLLRDIHRTRYEVDHGSWTERVWIIENDPKDLGVATMLARTVDDRPNREFTEPDRPTIAGYPGQSARFSFNQGNNILWGYVFGLQIGNHLVLGGITSDDPDAHQKVDGPALQRSLRTRG